MNISGRKRKKARLFRKGSWTTVQMNRVLGWPMRISTARMSLQNQPKLYRGLVFPFILISYWLQAAFEKRCHLTQLSFLRIHKNSWQLKVVFGCSRGSRIVSPPFQKRYSGNKLQRPSHVATGKMWGTWNQFGAHFILYFWHLFLLSCFLLPLVFWRHLCPLRPLCKGFYE